MRTPIFTLRTLVAALTFTFSAAPGCKKEEKQEDPSALIQKDPQKAIEILEQRYSADPSDYATIRGLAQAYTLLESPNWERAAAWYRKAIDEPQGQAREERRVLFDELLKCMEHQVEAARAAKAPAKKVVELLTEANQLERALARQNIKAGKALFDLQKARFDKKVAALDYKGAIAVIGGLSAIYVDEKTRATLASQLPKLERLKFEKDTTSLFNLALLQKLKSMGLFDMEQQAFTFNGRHEVVIPAPEPPPQGEPPPDAPPPKKGPDTTSDDFGKNMEAAACGEAVVIPRIKSVLNPFAKASALKRDLTDAELKGLYEAAKQNRKTRWEGEAWDKAKVYAPGAKLIFVCSDSLALTTVVKALGELRK